MRNLGIEGERVARLQLVHMVTVAIDDPPLQHIDELFAGMGEGREHLGFVISYNFV